MDERMKFGVVGMDDLTGGGLIPGNLYLLTGTTGTGKTITCSQFLHHGAKNGETGVYISFEESPENIKKNLAKLGIDFEKFEKENKILFVKYDSSYTGDITELIESNVRKIKAKRVVIDSISSMGMYMKDDSELRKLILDISSLLQKLECTSIIISEIPPLQNTLSRYGVEEFVADGIIIFYYLRTESQYSRSVTVWKMRGSKHSNKLHPYEITDKGIVIYPKEEAFVKF